MNFSFDDVREAANRLGLEALCVDREDRTARHQIRVWRQADDWAMPPVTIAIASTELEAYKRAMAALAKLAPQIAKQLPVEADDDEEEEPAFRLHEDDIEAIADAVYQKINGRVYARARMMGDL